MKYRCVHHFRCEKCGAETELTCIEHYDLPSPPVIVHEELCDQCADAMSEDERAAYLADGQEKARIHIEKIMSDGTFADLKRAAESARLKRAAESEE